MQCAWRNFIRRAFGEIARPPARRTFSTRPARRAFLTVPARRTFSTRLNSQPAPPNAVDELPALSPAQLGREASNVIRFLLSQRNVADAYLIVNSVRYAGLIHTASSLPGVKDLEHFRSVALAFTPNVSPRLPTHTLLHGLIRMHMFEEAGNLVAQMMAAGMAVRCRSLEVLFRTIPQATKRLPPTLSPVSNHPGTRFALHILELARESRQRRSRTMFKILLKLCLINGEIIVASLLFGTLLRDWQSRQLPSTAAASPATLTPHPNAFTGYMNKFCTAIDLHLLSNRTDPDSTLAFVASLQSLANLAHALDKRLFPFENIAAILCSMYRCPKGKERVWIPDEGHVEAYAYFHGVLVRLIDDLPTESSTTMLPFDIATTNTLLHYALQHRRSVRLAEKVFENMTRHNRLKPNESTINILTRAERLLRTSKIKGMCLKLLDQQTAKPESVLARAARAADTYTLSTVMKRLIESGNPRIVVDTLDDILPGLFSHRASNDDLMKRATYLGPVVLTNILNALEKTGRTGKAERVWHIARGAEKMSWDMVHYKGDEGMVVKPWCLPVHAYTIMIKVYAREAKKGRAYFLAQREGSERPLKPKLVQIAGWGRDPVDGRTMKTDEKARHYLGRQLAIKVYRAMSSAPEVVERRVRELQERRKRESFLRVVILKRHLDVPHPDAKLFDAILAVVGRHPHMGRRRPTRKRYALRLRKNLARFAAGRHILSRCDPALSQIAADMTRAGFAVPLLYQRLLIGTSWRDSGWRRFERDRRVWAVANKGKCPVTHNVDAIRVKAHRG